MNLIGTQNQFSFENHISSRGTPLLYIKYKNPSFRLSEEQKEKLKIILNNYFFYSKEKRMWGFVDHKDNKKEVLEFLRDGLIPERMNFISNKEEIVQEEKIIINLEDYKFKFIDVRGRPLFTFMLINGVVEITINLKHWFFKNKDNSEKEIVKKMVLSHVIASYEFTSPVIDSFNNKLKFIQESLYDTNL